MKTIRADELKQKLDSDGRVLLLDVLPEESYRKEHLPGAQSAPVGSDDFVSRAESLAGGRQREVVVYCASTDCDASPKAAKKLEEAGFENVIDFAGGLKEWKSAGHPLEGAEATAGRG